MRDYKLKLYHLCWIISLIVIVIFIRITQSDNNCIGLVESKSHQLGAQAPGTIEKMLVRIGDKVTKGQLIATLNMTDLENSLNQMENELSTINSLKNAQKEILSLEFQQMGLRIQNDASILSEQLSLIESKTTELNMLNLEIERLQEAEKAGLGYSRDLASLIMQREALNSYLKEQSKELQSHSQKIKKSRSVVQNLNQVNNDSMINVMLLEPMQRVEDIKREITIIQYQISARTIMAPCNGYVTDIFSFPGDLTDAFLPIVTIEETKPQYVNLYLSERSDFQAETGMKVKIHSKRLKGYSAKGAVEFVHPGFTMSNERLSFQGQPFWGRVVRVKLQTDHKFMPGEFVYARISKKKNEEYLVAKKPDVFTKSKNANKTENQLRDMHVPDYIRNHHRFEPSGLIWLPDLKKYIIISDDSGLKDGENEHVPVVFLMDDQGNVDSLTMNINGINTINDLEAITPIDNNHYFLISSQSFNKNMKRPVSREAMFQVTYENHQFQVTDQIALLSLIRQTFSNDELQSLGLTQYEGDQPIINIEGAAFHDNCLYLGLKEPISKNGAIVWKLRDPQSIFKKKLLEKDQLSLYGQIDLGEYKGHKAGISDLLIDPKGIMWITSTIPNVNDSDQLGGLHRIFKTDDGRLKAIHCLGFENYKPEGICMKNTDNLMIVFDRNQLIPKFMTLSMEEL